MVAKGAVVDEQAAAEVLDVSPRTLQRWRVSGRGPAFIKLGRKAVRYSPEDLLAFIDSCRRESTSQSA